MSRRRLDERVAGNKRRQEEGWAENRRRLKERVAREGGDGLRVVASEPLRIREYHIRILIDTGSDTGRRTKGYRGNEIIDIGRNVDGVTVSRSRSVGVNVPPASNMIKSSLHISR